ncbi:PepSY domain-containing protein [Methylophaga sp.]|uniref:PepSY domain-containing protein n=1 Tax=Methylophaga sp. TaxID=2024840 RepID=UPI003F6A50B7
MKNVLAACMFMLPLSVLANESDYFERCMQNVLKEQPGQVLKVELKLENEHEVYEFNVRAMDGTDWDLECQKKSGDILEKEQEVAHPNHPRFKQHVTINEREARVIALSKFSGEIVEVEYEIEANGNATYEFDIDTDKGEQIKIEIDAGSGEVVEINHELWQVGLE